MLCACRAVFSSHEHNQFWFFFSFPLTAARGMLNAKESPLRIPSLGPSDDGPEMCYVFDLINLLTEMSSYSKTL